MTSIYRMTIALLGLTAIALFGGCADEKPLQLTDQPCTVPPVLHCPDENCSAEVTNDPGPVVEPKTGRQYFLDYPCNLKKNEKVTVVLSIHGAGGHGNWHRHYFPMLDYVDKYRLVVATPNTPRPLWTPEDDDYLQNIVSSIIDRIGKKNIKALWLVGHSQGGMTSNRIVCSDFFKEKVDGWLSLSGGRIGPVTLPAAFKVPDSGEDGMPPALREISKLTGGARPGAASPPSCDISFIFTTGENEITGLPDTSPWADKYHCGQRIREEDIVDTKPGYVYNADQQGEPNPAMGGLPRPGTAEVYNYPNCDGGRVVADVLRLDKGHTEGLEPKVTEALIQMMESAPGGKVANGD